MNAHKYFRCSRAIAFTFALSIAFALASCKPPPQAAVSAPPAPPPYNTQISTDEVMAHVMEPAANEFWSSSGTSLTKAGETLIAPANEAEWKRAEDGAAMVVLATNTLMLPGYARSPQTDWNKHAQHLAEVAFKAKEAVEQRDLKAMFEIGIDLDAACEECHRQFLPPSLHAK